MGVTKVNRLTYKVDVELDYVQYNILAVALDHMWEHLNEIKEDCDIDDVINERIKKLKLMQIKFEV
jgi:hypothetical protein